jgi:hypothetical protein
VSPPNSSESHGRRRKSPRSPIERLLAERAPRSGAYEAVPGRNERILFTISVGLLVVIVIVVIGWSLW